MKPAVKEAVLENSSSNECGSSDQECDTAPGNFEPIMSVGAKVMEVAVIKAFKVATVKAVILMKMKKSDFEEVMTEEQAELMEACILRV